MKKIEAIVRSKKLDELEKALRRLEFTGMTVTEVRGLGQEKGLVRIYPGGEVAPPFVPRVKVELIVSDDRAQVAVGVICHAARTGEVGDGRILVTNLESVVNIRAGEISGPLHPARS